MRCRQAPGNRSVSLKFTRAPESRGDGIEVPSPIAHSSLVLLAPALLRGGGWETLGRKQRLILYGAIVFALCAPDLDFLTVLLPGESDVIDHGAFGHSFLVGAIFACFFAVACRLLVKIDLVRQTVRRGRVELHFTGKEFAMLRLLAEADGEPVSRERFLDVVWGYAAYPTTRTVDNHIASLRAKLEPEPGKPRFLKTVHGVGYRLERDK